MNVNADDFRRSYAELSDAALLSVKRDELTDVARQVYDQEMSARGLGAEVEPPSSSAAPGHQDAPGDALVEIATFVYPNDAKFARAELEGEGILCFMGNERTLDVDWFLSTVLGGYRLSVPAEHAARAREILDSRVSDEELEAQAAAEAPEDIA